MTLAEFREPRRPQRHEEAPAQVAQAAIGGRIHPGPAEYIKIGVALSIITAVEVGVYYLDVGTQALIATLLLLSGVKFSLVILWFMHLRFDSRLFSTMFVGGLALAFAIFMVVLATLESGLV